MSKHSEEELVLAAQRGDVESFVALCDRYYPFMVTVARAILEDTHLSEDAAQETFAKACTRLVGLRHPSRLGSWLAAICRNEAKSLQRRTPKLVSLGDHDLPERTCEDDPDVEFVRQAIKQMSVDDRELLYLRYRNELSYEEIAKLLNTTSQAVHGRLQRARRRVKKFIERQRTRRRS